MITATADPPVELHPERVAFAPGSPLSCDEVDRVARGKPACFTDAARAAMCRSIVTLDAARERGDAIYGLTTGFGPHVQSRAGEDAQLQGENLIAHLAAGAGPDAPRPLVRAMIAARCRTLAQGCSGVAVEAAEALLDLLERDVCPAVPMIGSVGASGDLIPMAHVAQVLTGAGEVLETDGRRRPALEALAGAGLKPVRLSARDALGIVNGTSFMTAAAALAACRADRLVARAEDLTGWTHRALGARRQSLDPRLHAARGHAGQIDSAARIAAASAGEENPSRPLQEVYSIRCAPQILGACREQLAYARRLIETELAGVTDNPVICGDPLDPAVLHGGNFQGQQIAFAADAINSAVTQTANLIERQLDAICNPEITGGPLLLAWSSGATSGMAGAQITATAMLAELRRNAQPGAVASLPTNGRNQDIVSMGAMAARVAYEQTERAAAVLAIHAIGLTQLAHLQTHGRAPGEAAAPPAWLPEIMGFEADRPLRADTARLAEALLSP